MANCFHSGLPEEANWVQTNAALGKGCTVLVPWPLPSPTQQPNASSSFNSNGYPPCSIPCEGVGEDRSVSASKSHSQAEKRRRDRINAQLASLRKFIPKSDKMDKAHLLATVVDHVKELKRRASEVYKVLTLPTEVDEVTVDCELDQDFPPSNIDQSKSCIFIKASLCCDDRPELFSELIQALKGLKLTTVRADMASLGGRIKGILVLCTEDAEEGICINTLKQTLKVALSRLASSSTVPTNRITSKRQRFFFPSASLQVP
ncbi:Myc-type, basic helix-loop-helix (bHLH) domain [Dillenia turbinata]|uniref:Myc-type, basic helix-loop-helix (BHLH) domain n=1 Tax=Dillenia turbinata TaxID=194707 RepID=A0AAN8Z921_9MAGN